MPDQQTAELGSLVNTMESNGVAPDSDALDKVAKNTRKTFRRGYG